MFALPLRADIHWSVKNLPKYHKQTFAALFDYLAAWPGSDSRQTGH
jgi:hypothetical protein